MIPERSGKQTSSRAIIGILFLGLVMGVIYTFLVPPWQHYDEPGQFEYAWLYANYPGRPEPGFYDQRMRREVAASMLEHGFFNRLDYRPNLLSQTEPVSIGITQVGDQPLYYWLVSLPLRLAKYSDITFQLYVARLASLSMFLLVILSAWGLMKEIVSSTNSPLIGLVPLTIVLIPGVVDMLTSVNNDVGAAAFFSLFLWGCTRMLKQGVNVFTLLWAALAALACYFTKSTVWVALPLLSMILFINIFPPKYRWLPIGVIIAGIIVTLYAFLGGGNAAGWVIPGLNLSPTRQQISNDPVSGYALRITLNAERPNQNLRQSFSPETRTNLKNRDATISGRTWASNPARLEIGFRSGSGWQAKFPVEVSTEKESFTTQISIPENAINVWFEITCRADELVSSELDIFVDQLALNIEPAPEATTTSPNQFNGANSDILVNPSGEKAWFRLRSWVYQRIPPSVYANMNYFIYSLSNLPATHWYYQKTIDYLLQTFWSRLGWGNVALPGNYTYAMLWIVSLSGFLGAAQYLWRTPKSMPKFIIFFLITAAIILWIQALLRGVSSYFGPIWIPSARYALPAVAPTTLVLCAGWYGITKYVSQGKANRLQAGWYLYWIFFAGLNTLAIISLINFYYL